MHLIDPFPGKYDASDPFGSLGYGRKNGHTGSDWIVPAGSSVPAIGDGVVVAKSWHDGNGNYVCVKLEDGHYFAYLHLQVAASVNVGDRITRGQIIAKSGNTGTNSQGAHLHVTISDSVQAYVGLGNKVDPFGFIAARLSNGSSPAPAPAAGSGGTYALGIADATGLQRMLRARYAYVGEIDNDFGSGSWAAFARFLRATWGYVGNDIPGPDMWAAIARWLRAKYGYVGNDVPGPIMRAALQRASDANGAAVA